MSVAVIPNGTVGTKPSEPEAGINRLLSPVLVAAYRAFGGIPGRGGPMLLLTTLGAKSGKIRTNPLLYFVDEQPGWLIVAAQGAARHPAYYLNMARHPDQIWAQVGRRRVRVEAQTLSGADRQAAWGRIASQSPVLKAYQDRTDREMPVIRVVRPTVPINPHETLHFSRARVTSSPRPVRDSAHDSADSEVSTAAVVCRRMSRDEEPT